jgi:hypothetical protein
MEKSWVMAIEVERPIDPETVDKKRKGGHVDDNING